MSPVLKDFLRPVIEVYNERRDKNDLNAPVPEEMRNFCLSGLEARMEALDDKDPEYGECAFISQALKNGWLVSDIESLITLYSTVQNLPDQLKPYGNKLIGQIASSKIETLADRYDMLGLTNSFWTELGRENSKKYREIMLSETKKLSERPVIASEYPRDNDFAKTSGGRAVSRFGDKINDNDIFDTLNAQQEIRARENTEYVFDEISEETLQRIQNRPFVPNPGQRFNKITKSASKAVSEVLGSSVYDDIREMNRGTVSERKVKLHHSVGTKHQKEGCDVLEMEFAGSGGQDVVKPYKDRNGAVDKTLPPEKALKLYGTQAKKEDGTPFDYIFYKTRSVEMPDGSNAEKKRYTFPGPTPDLKYGRGLPNLGEYSIENTREYAKNFAAEFLKKRFDKWISGEEKPKPIHIDLSGHSRGAVTAGQAAKKIDAWITEYIQTHPDPKVRQMDLKQYVHYDLRLLDPVPGAITNIHMGSCNLRAIPNMNATVFCSLGIQAPDMFYPLQHVKGAKKLILTMTDHSMDQYKTDVSQKDSFKDGKYHALGYYDAETGELFRGSGMNELPDGVYIADKNHALIRITSYSQVKDLFNKVYDKSSPQKVRSRRIHKMVRDWFIENELESGFADEQTRKTETAKNKVTKNKILQVNTKRIRAVKAEIRALEALRKSDPTKEQLIEQNNRLIKACRDYMKDTAMPPKGVTAYKVGLVADALSYTMRENNYLKKQLKLEKGEQPAPDIDDKILAHRKRLESKPGYLKRKIEEESKRLEQEKKLLELMKAVKDKCQDSLKTLDQTKIGESSSGIYDKMHKVLVEGSKLGAETSVNDMNDFFKRFRKAAEDYRISRDSLLGPMTGDGIIRLNESKLLEGFSKEASKIFKKAAAEAGLGEDNAPLGIKAADRSARIEQMKARQAEMEKPEAVKKDPAPAMLI